jgi:AraC-like DNA-binding protein
MRQIVRKKRPIVQASTRLARRAALACGHADAALWPGGGKWVAWTLERAIGFLLPLDTAIEATCSAGVTNELQPGELLVINRGGADTLRIRAVQNGSGGEPAIVTGHIRLSIAADSFAATPSRAMALVPLQPRELIRISTLSRLLAAESGRTMPTASSDATTTDGALIGHLGKALFESLADVLCACDPLGLPQFAAMSDARLALALKAMTAEPARPWRVETLAREAALSRTLFATRFKLILGTTPLEYLTALRVQLASTIREESPGRTLHDIAQSVGYADESALRRAQRRVMLRCE